MPALMEFDSRIYWIRQNQGIGQFS